MPDSWLEPATVSQLVRLAGVGQLILVAASPAIPRVLGWRKELEPLRPLTRQLFWTWATYVWVSHLAFGLLSTFRPDSLVEPTPLAGFVSAFIATWWGARLVIQFTYFDRTAAPPGRRYQLAEAGLVALFTALLCIYGLVAWMHFGRLR
jgi:hypothetical protein